MTEEQPSLSESQFGQALQRYQDGAEAADVIADFEAITRRDPRQAASSRRSIAISHAHEKRSR